MAACRSCDAEITWATSEQTGKPIPLDATPTANGNLALVNGKAHYYGADDERLHRERYTSHFATCPEAASWRKK
jgi:hypothetical protein